MPTVYVDTETEGRKTEIMHNLSFSSLFCVCVFLCFFLFLNKITLLRHQKVLSNTAHDTLHYEDESYHVRWYNLEYKDICVCVCISHFKKAERISVQGPQLCERVSVYQTGQIVLFSNDNLYSIAIAKNRNYFDSKNSIKCSDVRVVVVVVKVYCEVRMLYVHEKKLLEKDKCIGKLGVYVCVCVCVRLNSPGRSLTRDWLFSFE